MPVPELGHAVLYVRDLERSRRFYGEILGWTEVGLLATSGRPMGAAFSGGRTHHELLLIEVGYDVDPIPGGRRVGLSHIGVKVGDDDDALREVRDRLVAADVEVLGASDRGVIHALHVADPDGNELELYVDVVGPDVWRRRPEALLRTPTPLEL